VPLPNPEVGAERLRSGVTFAVAGDPAARAMATDLGGVPVVVADEDRANYHAAATVAANHLVALLGQVERVAATAGLPLGAFAGLIHAAADDALALGPHAALTGPAVRGDWATVDRHRAALAAMPGGRNELVAYDAMVVLARRLSLVTPEPELIAELDLEATFAEDPFVPAIGDTPYGHTAAEGVPVGPEGVEQVA
jgi:predicted short-subunit dehydrogenase-like oxidoreductase (DUF2520 family)